MAISISQSYVNANPTFALTQPLPADELRRLTLRPKPTQKLILYRCLEPVGSAHPLEQLAGCCENAGYRGTFKSEDNIPKSILWHLKYKLSQYIREL